VRSNLEIKNNLIINEGDYFLVELNNQMNQINKNNSENISEINEGDSLSPGILNSSSNNMNISPNFSSLVCSHFPLWKDEEEYQPEYPNDYEEVKYFFI
jgi:hypothetical protein